MAKIEQTINLTVSIAWWFTYLWVPAVIIWDRCGLPLSEDVVMWPVRAAVKVRRA